MINETQQALHHQQHHFADLEAIPNQIGHAILNIKDGSLVHPPNGSLTQHDIGLLYEILLEVGETTKGSISSKPSGDKLRVVTIEGSMVSYNICATADGYVYLVKRKNYEY